MTDPNKRFAELAGICWHEWDWDGDRYICTKCEDRLADHTVPTNPDFTDATEVLKVMRAREDFGDFLYRGLTKLKGCVNKGLDRAVTDLFKSFVETYILDTTGLLRDEAIKWMEGRK